MFAFGPFVLDRDRRLLARDGAPVGITPKAFDLLVVLVERSGAAVTKDELMSALWPDTAVEENNLTFQISTLRKALGADGARFIATLPGRGYQFVAPLQRIEAAEAIVEDEERTTITIAESTPPLTWIRAVALVAIVLGAVIGAVVLRREPAASSPSIRSLAVLPFKPLAVSQRDEALELGMADTLITRLSAMPDVVVRPISAVRRYSRLEDDPLEAGRALDVDAVVDGSIQRRGSRMRVTVRLLRTSDGKPLWASQLDESTSDLFAVQDLVAEHVAQHVAGEATPKVARRTTADLEAYELYLKGRYVALSDPRHADEFYRRAVERDPKFAEAWAAIADTWLFRGRYRNKSSRAELEQARDAAMKAVTLAPDLADGHAALAQVHADLDWDFPRAEREYRRALELNPSSATAHGQYAYLLLFRRDFDGAIAHMRQAAAIDPVSPLSTIGHAFALHAAGRYDESIAILEKTLRVHPNLIPAMLHLGIAHTDAGRPEVGIAWFREGLKLSPASTQLLPLEAYAQAKAGHRDAALAIVRDLEKRAARESISPSNIALAYTALGDHDRAFAWLERGFQERLFLVRTAAALPGFEPLRKDPRYADLMRRMGL